MKKELLCAAYLTDLVKNKNTPEFSKLDIDRVLGHLKRNKIPLLYLDHNENFNWFFNSDQFRKSYQEELKLCQRRKKEYLLLKRAFREAGIPLILFKSSGRFTYVGSDLDVLVKSKDRSRIYALMKELGYIRMSEGKGSEPYKIAYRKLYGDFSYYDAEFYENIVWFSHFTDANLLFERSKTSKNGENIEILSNEDRVLSVIAHCLYQSKSITLSDVTDIRFSIGRDFDYSYIFSIASRKGWINGLYRGIYLISKIEERLYGEIVFDSAIVADAMTHCGKRWRSWVGHNIEEIELPLNLPHWHIRFLYVKKIFSDQDVTYYSKVRDFIGVALKAVRGRVFKHNYGFLIAFSGIDGAGKTSMATEARRSFKRHTEISKKPKLTWSRVDGHRITNLVYKLSQPLIGKKFNTFRDVEKAEILRRYLPVRYIWTYLNVLGLLAKFLIKIQTPIILQKKVIICDRYNYDVIVDIISLLPDDDINRKIVTSLFRFLAPKPDVTFLLNVDPVAAYERLAEFDKQRLGIDMVRRRARLYLELAKGIRKLYVIENNNDIKSITNIVTKISLEKYFEK